ncbi:ABC transporter permease [Dyadobacter psychrophilus]|uniref:Lipoprotein-releasing system permease protein n=1 Tax=Dyadobacter psychrophilus TaxID=651661 RepID=A0A1T5B884_9BACT|nr:FtsX-like permease family protein [Dyadobacter psychrophilus]SKB43462.1 lipoprotein-releasing system permease protein [Dyadobacter psychrophilus]
MKLKLIMDISWALLLARWKQTLVAAAGVTFSIAMFISLLGFMTGLNVLLDGLILNRVPHVRLYKSIRPSQKQPVMQVPGFRKHYHFISSVKAVNASQQIRNSQAILTYLRNDHLVIGATPRITTQVFFNDGNIDLTGIVQGIDPALENKLFNFDEYMISGSAADLSKMPNSIILGKTLADLLLADVGEVIQLTTTQGQVFQLKVVGLFQSGIQEYDKTQSYASVNVVQKLLGKTASYVTDIQIKLTDITQAPAVAKKFAQIFETDAEDIQTANAQFETGSFIRTLISYAVGITVLIVAGFGIYNILNMMIYEKMDTIAILKATGFSGKDVKTVFLLIALVIGLFGGLLGLLAGFGISVIVDQIPFVTPSLPTITTYPVNYDPWFYGIGIVFSLATTLLAGWLPSRKASKVDPVVIIRGK